MEMGQKGFSYTVAEGRGTVAGLARELERFAEELGWSMKYVFQLNLVLDEVITNAISYGYEDPGNHEISVDMTLDDRCFRIVVCDNAAPFNPLEDGPPPELEVPLESRRHVGGLGIHIIKNLMDVIRYERRDGKNILTMEKDTRNCTEC